MFRDPKTGVRAFYSFNTFGVVHALEEASKFVAAGVEPGCFESGVVDELAVFELFSGFFVENGVGVFVRLPDVGNVVIPVRAEVVGRIAEPGRM